MASPKKKPTKKAPARKSKAVGSGRKSGWIKSNFVILVVVALVAGAVGLWLLANLEAASKKQTAKVVHLHSSGRHDRSTTKWKKGMEHIIKKNDVSVVTATEAAGRKAAFSWNGWKSTKAESIVAWDSAVWEVKATRVVELAPKVKFFRKVVASVAVLKHKQSGQTWMWVATHVPSSVDAGNGKFRKTSRNAPKWLSTMQHLSKKVIDWQKHYDVGRGRTVITADWNVNLTHKQWRKTIKKYFPSRSVATPSTYKGSGTHGSRVIDTSLISPSAKTVSWKVLPWRNYGSGKAPSDHRPVLAVYKFEYKPGFGFDKLEDPTTVEEPDEVAQPDLCANENESTPPVEECSETEPTPEPEPEPVPETSEAGRRN